MWKMTRCWNYCEKLKAIQRYCTSHERFEPRREKNGLLGFRPGLTQTGLCSYRRWLLARCLKFWILEEEELYYPSSENKGADQLCRYCTADLRLCFHTGENPVCSRHGSFVFTILMRKNTFAWLNAVNLLIFPLAFLEEKRRDIFLTFHPVCRYVCPSTPLHVIVCATLPTVLC